MESLGEILKKKAIPANTSGANTDIWLSAEAGEESSPDSTCPLCKGAGFVYPLLASGRPDFSRVVPCKCTHGGLQKEKLAQLQQYSNLGALSRLTFDNLLQAGRHSEATSQQYFTQAYEAAKAFAADPKGWLVLIGPGGCGKTHLACAIANHRLSLAQPAFYIGVADLLDHLRSTFSPSSDIAYDELFERVKNTPLLVLDDLTMAVTTAWAKGKLKQLLDHRFNTQLPTVITSDVPIEEFEEDLRGRLTAPEFCQICVIQGKSSPSLEHLGGLELELLRKMSFKNFDCKRLNLPAEHRQNLEQAFRIAFNFAQSPQGWLVFQGVNGCGKTHLAAAIANHLHQEGKSVLFIVVPDLLDYLRSTFSPESRVSYDELFEKVKKAPVLILDDFGEQSATPWAQEKLYQLINYRYNARLATVITTCFSLDEIESRISSRMVDPSLSLVFNIMAPDYRGDIQAAREARLQQRYSRRGRQS
ncbi:MAG TPA: ATP-binding protein [Dehalococcoidia bacterium]|nr:ATP-binding protein [Dehalococcoidia bacterium]